MNEPLRSVRNGETSESESRLGKIFHTVHEQNQTQGYQNGLPHSSEDTPIPIPLTVGRWRNVDDVVRSADQWSG